MREILRFIVKFHFVLLFVFLFVFSLSLIFVSGNDYEEDASNIGGRIYNVFAPFKSNGKLKKENEILLKENVYLHNLCGKYRTNGDRFANVKDTDFKQQYEYTSAKIVNVMVNGEYNYLTIDKGWEDGIKPEYGVLFANSIIGVVGKVSRNFSTIIPIINPKLKISAKIKTNNYFGIVCWDGKDYREVQLNDIPYHAKFNIGDTIVTSGFSTIFPEDVVVGTISSYKKLSNDNFYTITVKLALDFRQINTIYLVKNLLKDEQENLEEEQKK